MECNEMFKGAQCWRFHSQLRGKTSSEVEISACRFNEEVFAELFFIACRFCRCILVVYREHFFFETLSVSCFRSISELPESSFAQRSVDDSVDG